MIETRTTISPRIMVVWICALTTSLTAAAQQHDLTNGTTAYIKNFDIKDGIVQHNINALMKDHEGFVWVGTDEGLLKYNGHEFVAFIYSPSDTGSLSDNSVLSLFE